MTGKSRIETYFSRGGLMLAKNIFFWMLFGILTTSASPLTTSITVAVKSLSLAAMMGALLT